MVSKAGLKMLKRKWQLYPLWLKVLHLPFPSFFFLFFSSRNPPYHMCFGSLRGLSAFYGMFCYCFI